jgi:large subunit ribosomal protein L18
MLNKKEILRAKRHVRIKLKMHGTSDHPRLVVVRSLKNISAQLVDDSSKKVIFSLSTKDKSVKSKFPSGGNVKASQAFGELFAQKAKEKGFSTIIFDRAGYLYHGRVKAFADALRKGGLQF